MTNEELATLIGNGHTDLIPQLWENLRKLFFCIDFRYAKVYRRRMSECGVTIDDLHQECFFVMMASIRAYNSRSEEQSYFPFTAYIKLQYRKHMQRVISIKGRGRPNDALNRCNIELDSPIGEDEDCTLIHFLPDKESEEKYREIEESDYYSLAMNTARSLLSEKQWDLINRYYLKEQSLKTIANEYGVSTSAIQNSINTALRKLRMSAKICEALEINEYKYISVKGYMKCGSIEERIAEFKESLRENSIK